MNQVREFRIGTALPPRVRGIASQWVAFPRARGNRREGTAMAELDPRRWKALAIVCAAFFMTVLDVSIVNVALPSIGRALDFSRENLQWVITAYSIAFGGFLLLGGRAADLLGRRRVFMVG